MSSRALRAAAVGTVLLSTALVAGSADAAPQPEQIPLAGEVFDCGATTLTVTGGYLVGNVHQHQLRDGQVQVVFEDHLVDATAVDQSGTTYVARGGANASFTYDSAVADSEVGHHRVKASVIGPNGLFGTINESITVTRSGHLRINGPGTCTEQGEG